MFSQSFVYPPVIDNTSSPQIEILPQESQYERNSYIIQLFS